MTSHSFTDSSTFPFRSLPHDNEKSLNLSLRLRREQEHGRQLFNIPSKHRQSLFIPISLRPSNSVLAFRTRTFRTRT